MTISNERQHNNNMQKTLQKSIFFQGKGLFTGEDVHIKLVPSEEDSGVVFKRVDHHQSSLIPATVNHVIATPRCTVLGNKYSSVQTVEHLLSALSALQIDNLLVEINGPELPACDGSAKMFVQMIEQAGIRVLEKPRKLYRLKKTIHFSTDGTHLIAIPSEELCISNTLHYPHSNFLRSQFYSFLVKPKEYKSQIAPCRTFSLYEEIEPMLKKGLLKGAGLENGVVIKDDKVVNPEGLRFGDEMVRHKILDLLGDLFLIGKPFLAHIIAIRSGHAANVAFAREILKNLTENP